MKYIEVYGEENGSYDIAIKASDSDNKRLKKLNAKTLNSLHRYASEELAYGTKEKIHRVINGIVKYSLQSNEPMAWEQGSYEEDAYLIKRAMSHKFQTSAALVHKGLTRANDAQLATSTSLGHTFSFQEFVSTSYLLMVPRNFASTGVILRIDSPIGIPVDTNRDEREFLLPAESVFKVLSVNQEEMWGDDYDGYREFTVVHVEQHIP